MVGELVEQLEKLFVARQQATEHGRRDLSPRTKKWRALRDRTCNSPTKVTDWHRVRKATVLPISLACRQAFAAARAGRVSRVGGVTAARRSAAKAETRAEKASVAAGDHAPAYVWNAVSSARRIRRERTRSPATGPTRAEERDRFSPRAWSPDAGVGLTSTSEIMVASSPANSCESWSSPR